MSGFSGMTLAQRLRFDPDATEAAIDSVVLLVGSGCPSVRLKWDGHPRFGSLPGGYFKQGDSMLTNRFVGRQDSIVLDELGVTIRVVSCDGDSVDLEVIAPPSVSVRVADDVFPQTYCDEVQDAPRPSPIGRPE